MSTNKFPWVRTLRTYCLYNAKARKPLGFFRYQKDAKAKLPAKLRAVCVIVQLRGTYVVPRKVAP